MVFQEIAIPRHRPGAAAQRNYKRTTCRQHFGQCFGFKMTKAIFTIGPDHFTDCLSLLRSDQFIEVYKLAIKLGGERSANRSLTRCHETSDRD